MWNNVCAQFDAETGNLGSRNERASHLYETRTVLTIGGKNVERDPFVRCSVFVDHLAIALDNVVHVFDPQYRTFCSLSFETCIDSIALQSDIHLLFVGDRNLNLHIAKTDESKVHHTIQVRGAQEVSAETGSFQAVDITQIDADDYMLCLLVQNSSLVFCKFRSDALIETLEKGEIDHFFKFVYVDISHDINWKAPFSFESTFCTCNEQYLVAGIYGTLFCVPHKEDGSLYRLFAEFPGGPIIKMVASQDGRSVIILNSEGDVFTICSKTFLISSTWTGKKVKDFVLMENVGKEGGESQFGILTGQVQEIPRKLQIYSYPALKLLYSLVVNDFCMLAALSPGKGQFCIVEGIADDEKKVVRELRIRTVCEALPETRLATLIKKRKFLEAEELAHLFGIPVEEVHWQHLLYLLNELALHSTSTNEGKPMVSVDNVTSIIQKLPDKSRAAKCCIDAVPASPSSARQLFEFLQKHISTLNDPNCTKYDGVHAEIASVLNRITTFELMHADDSKWLAFLKADFLEGMCTLLHAEDVSRALLVWMRHCDQISLTRESVGQILNAVPATMTAVQIIDWLSSGFLFSVLHQTHDAMEEVCLWVINKVMSMEIAEKSAWPSAALRLLSVIPELYESVRSDSTLMTVRTWIAVHSIPRLITTESSPFYRLYYLLSDLKNLEVLWKEHQCYPTLQELQNPDQQEVVFSVLDGVTTHSAVSKVIQQFLLPYLKSRNIDASKVLAAYIDEVLISSPFTWWHWENAPWEDKVTAITKFITNPTVLLESIDRILAQAPVPWSKSIEALAMETQYLGLEASDQVNAQRRVMQVKVILRDYKMRNFNCRVLSDMKTIIRNILLSGKPTSLADALEIVKNIQIATEEDVFMWHLESIFLNGDVDNFADSLRSLPESIVKKVGSRAANFGWLYLSRYHTIYSPKMDGVAECYMYLLDILHRKTCNSVFRQRRDQVDQMRKLHKEFGIKVNLFDVASSQKRHAVLEKGFQNCIGKHSYVGAEELCKKLLAISNVLKLDRESAIETLIQAALKSRQHDIVQVLLKTLFDGNRTYKITTSLLKTMVGTSEDVLNLASELHGCASSVLSATPGNRIQESIKICQWTHFLLGISNASHPDKVSSTSDPYSTWKLSSMYETQGFALEKGHSENAIQHLSAVVWLPPVDTDKLHTLLTESYTNAHIQLGQKAQTEMCLRLCAIINQHNSCNVASQQLTCQIKQHEEQALKAMIMRATTLKNTDFTFVAGLFGSLPPSEALVLMKQLIFQSGTNYRLLKALVAIGSKVATGIPQVKSKFDSLFRNAFWGRRLAAFGISFKNALMSSDIVTRQNILDEMAVMSAVDIETIRDYSVENGLSFENVMVKRVEFLLKQAGDMFCQDISDYLENTEKALEFIPPEQAVKTLRKLIGKVDPYCYEIIKFGYSCIAKIQPSTVNVDRELRVIDFLASYRRHAKPTAAEMDAWFNDHPECEEIPAVSHERLPFHWLLQKSPWKFLNDEIYPETVAAWLSIADALELDGTQIRFVAIENAVTLWSSRKANGAIFDMKLISTIHRLIKEMGDTDMALACAATVIKGLPRGPTRTKAAELSTTLAFHHSQLETPVPAAHKKYLTFNKLYVQYKIEQVLSQRGLDTPDYTGLASKPEELVQKLLENSQWHSLFSDTATIYKCIKDIIDNCNCGMQDDILRKKVESWLNCCPVGDMTLDQSMILNLHVGQDRSDEQVGFTSCIHLMQHLPQTESKKMLWDIVNNAHSCFGLQQEVSGMQCALASFSKEDCEDLFALPFPTALSHLRCISYKARLQDIGIPLPLEHLDKTKAAELASNVISSRGQNPKALQLVFLLCMEFEVGAVDLWNSLLSNAAALNMVDLLMASLLTLGRVPAMWHKPTFQNAWQTVLKTQMLQERCSLLLRCSVLHDLPLDMFAQESKNNDTVLFSLICTVLQAKGKFSNALEAFLSSLPQSLLAKLACSEDKNGWLFLQLPQVRRACDLPS